MDTADGLAEGAGAPASAPHTSGPSMSGTTGSSTLEHNLDHTMTASSSSSTSFCSSCTCFLALSRFWQWQSSIMVSDVLPNWCFLRCGAFFRDWWSRYPLWLAICMDLTVAMNVLGAVLFLSFLTGWLSLFPPPTKRTFVAADTGESSSTTVAPGPGPGQAGPGAGDVSGAHQSAQSDDALHGLRGYYTERPNPAHEELEPVVIPVSVSLFVLGIVLHTLLFKYNRATFDSLLQIAKDYSEGSRIEAFYRLARYLPNAQGQRGAGFQPTPEMVRAQRQARREWGASGSAEPARLSEVSVIGIPMTDLESRTGLTLVEGWNGLELVNPESVHNREDVTVVATHTPTSGRSGRFRARSPPAGVPDMSLNNDVAPPPFACVRSALGHDNVEEETVLPVYATSTTPQLPHQNSRMSSSSSTAAPADAAVEPQPRAEGAQSAAQSVPTAGDNSNNNDNATSSANGASSNTPAQTSGSYTNGRGQVLSIATSFDARSPSASHGTPLGNVAVRRGRYINPPTVGGDIAPSWKPGTGGDRPAAETMAGPARTIGIRDRPGLNNNGGTGSGGSGSGGTGNGGTGNGGTSGTTSGTSGSPRVSVSVSPPPTPNSRNVLERMLGRVTRLRDNVSNGASNGASDNVNSGANDSANVEQGANSGENGAENRAGEGPLQDDAMAAENGPQEPPIRGVLYNPNNA